MTKTRVIFKEYDGDEGEYVSLPIKREIELAEMAGLEVVYIGRRVTERILANKNFISQEAIIQDGKIAIVSLWEKRTLDDVLEAHKDKKNLKVAYDTDETHILMEWEIEDKVEIFIPNVDLVDFLENVAWYGQFRCNTEGLQIQFEPHEERLRDWAVIKKAKNGQN